MKKLFLVTVVAAGALCGCGGKQAEQAAEEKAGNDSTLIVYYSQTGTTKAVAEELQKQLGCDIVAIEALEPYDCDYPSTIARWRSELENGEKVGINPVEVNLDDYHTIFLGFPIWGGNYASPMATFLEDYSLAGKKVVTFATFGSGGIDGATKSVAAAQPEAEVVQGYGVRNARVAKAPAEIVRFLAENGFIDAEIEALPAYSESVPVTDADTAIFNQACGSYQFPLGTPVEVASRKTPAGTDYKFGVESQGPDGQKSVSTIYVTVEEGAAPEFTEVVRL